MRSFKRVAAWVGKAALLLAMAAGLYLLCMKYLVPPSCVGRAMDELQNDPNEVTTLFVGASLAEYAYVPAAFDEAAGGGYSFNLSSVAQTPEAMYAVLQQVLPQRKSRRVIIDCNWRMLSRRTGDGASSEAVNANLVMLDALPLGRAKVELAFGGLPPENWIDAALPFFRYRGNLNLNRITRVQEERAGERNNYYVSRGYASYPQTLAADSVGRVALDGWDGADEARMAKIRACVALCRRYSAEPVFIAPPISVPALLTLTNYDDYLACVRQLAQEESVSLLDFNLIRPEVWRRSSDGYYAVDEHANHMAGGQLADSYSRLVARLLGQLDAGTLRMEDCFYSSYGEFLQQVTAVEAVWMDTLADGRVVARTLTAPQVAAEVRFSWRPADTQQAFAPLTAYGDPDTLTLPDEASGSYELRVEARAVGCADAYQQCDTITVDLP